MKTSAFVLAFTGSALAANVNLNVLMRRDNNAVCRTYTSSVLVPCSTSSMAMMSSSAAPTSSAPPVESSSSSTPPSSSSSPAQAPSSSSTPPPSSSSSTPPASSSSTPVPSSSSSSSSSSMSTPTPTPSKSTSSSSTKTSSSTQPTKTYPTVPGFYCGCEWLVNDETLYCVNKTTGSYRIIKDQLAGNRGAKFNALAFHPQTLGLFAVVDDPGFKSPAVIGSIDGKGNYSARTLIDTKWKVGEIDEYLNYWVMDNTTWGQYEADIYAGPNKDGSGFLKSKATGAINFAYYVYDWAYLQGTGKYLWSIGNSKADGSSALVRWDMTSHTWSVIKNYGNLDGINEWGPAWGYLDSKLWMQESKTGDIYQVTVPNGTPSKLSTAKVITPAFNNDGAKCWNNTLSYNKMNGPPPPGY